MTLIFVSLRAVGIIANSRRTHLSIHTFCPHHVHVHAHVPSCLHHVFSASELFITCLHAHCISHCPLVFPCVISLLIGSFFLLFFRRFFLTLDASSSANISLGSFMGFLLSWVFTESSSHGSCMEFLPRTALVASRLHGPTLLISALRPSGSMLALFHTLCPSLHFPSLPN